MGEPPFEAPSSQFRPIAIGVEVVEFLANAVGALGTTMTLIRAPLPGLLIVPLPISFFANT